MSNRIFIEKILAIMLVLVLVVNSSYSVVFAQEKMPDKIQVSNDFVKYTINSENARFSIRTNEGVPYRDDNNSKLLFEEDKPDTSFTTFKIDGEEYIYGNEYGFLGINSSFVKVPSTIDKKTESIWKLGQVEIIQTLELLKDESNSNVGNVRITYTVKNKGSKDISIGTRILLDTMLGSNDGTAVILAGQSEPITKEKKIEGNDIPRYWRSLDDLFSPSVISYGFTNGWGNIKPDEMIIGHWNNLSETKWDYEVNSNLDFTNRYNKYSSADSAVAMYWNPTKVSSGKTKVFETFYGIGDFQSYKDDAKFTVNLNVPNKLEIDENNTGYENDTFEVIAEIDNTLSNASDLNDVTASLILEDGLEILDSDFLYKDIDKIKANEIHTFKWLIKANPQTSYAVKQFRVDVSTKNNLEPISGSSYVLLPAVNGEPPSIQFHDVSPNILYYKGSKSFTINGIGYDVYKDKSNWKMLLINELTNEIFQVPSDTIIVNDKSIMVNIENDFETGKYKIKIEHEYLNDEQIPQSIEMSNDKKYKSRSYGILYIKKSKLNNKWKYTLETAIDIDELKNIRNNFKNDDNNDIILDIKGNVKEYKEDGATTYRVFTDSECAIFNSVMQYKGQPLVITRVDDTSAVDGIDTIKISGDGKLTVENGFSFWWWEFEIKITDEIDYHKNILGQGETLHRINKFDNRDYIEELLSDFDGKANIEIIFTGLGNVMKSISSFFIQIDNALILENGISFCGNTALSFLPGVKDNGIEVSVDNILFGRKNNGEVGFRGINSEAKFDAMKDTVPLSIIQNGFVATLKINTIENKYSIEGEVNIKLCEAYVNFSIMKDTSTNSYYPDDIKIAGGYNPGIPIGATGAFITKVGGGVEDLYGTITGDSTLPPMQIVLLTSINFAKIIKADLSVRVSEDGFTLDGEGEIAKIKCLKSIHIGLRWAKPASFDLGAQINLFDIINGEISLFIKQNEWEGKVVAKVFVPKKVWLVGGKEVGRLELGANESKIWSQLKIIGIPVEITYYWGGEVDFDIGCTKDILLAINNGQDFTSLEDNDGNGMTMVVGSNISRIGNSKTRFASLNGYFSDKKVVASLDSTKHYFDIKNQEIALIELKYNEDIPKLSVYKPNGDKYELISEGENANYLVQEISASDSSTGKPEKYVFISIIKPDDGKWRVESDVSFDSSLMNVVPTPVLKTVDVNKLDNNKLEVLWSADYTDNAVLDLFLAKDLNETGIPIAKGIIASNESTIIEIPSDIESGDYYIRAAIQKVDFGYDSMYTDNTINIVDEYQPSPVTNINAVSYGNGLLYAEWDSSEDKDIEGYYVSVYDEDGNILESLGHKFVNASKKQIIIGGRYKLEGSDELLGLQPGSKYKIGVVVSKKVGNEDNYSNHYSNMAFSNTVYIEEPNPATINIVFDDSFIDNYNDEGRLTKISNKDEISLNFNSDQSEITTEIYVNGVLYETNTKQSFEIKLPTEDGNYIVEFRTINNNGDTSAKTVNYTIDKTEPILLVESPISGQIAENGYIYVKGISEKGAQITVNNTIVECDDEGVFEKTLQLDNKLSESVVIKSKDKANNITIFETNVVNDNILPIEKVYIKPIVNQMDTGDTKSFELIAVDVNGKKIVLENDKIRWVIIKGERLASISDEGVLTAFEHGDIVLKASYSIADDYSYEDAIDIKILEKEEDTTNDDTQDTHDSHSSKKDKIDKILKHILSQISFNENELEIINAWKIKAMSDNRILVSNELDINIPSNAIKSNNNLLIAVVKETERYVSSNQIQKKLLSQIYEILIEDDTQSFEAPFELIFTYNRDNVTDISDLGIYYFNEQFRKWQYIGGVINKQKNTITANINHFSKYALLENKGLKKLEDTKSRWSEDYIYGLVSLGIIDGVMKDDLYYYYPERPITRLEFTKLIVQSNINNDNLNKIDDLPFVDWEEIPEWGKHYVKTAYEKKLIKGIPTENGVAFDGSSYITRAQAATIIGRTIEEKINGNGIYFIDESEIPKWAKNHIDVLVNRNILNGYSDNYFRPNNNITREEAAKMIIQWLNK